MENKQILVVDDEAVILLAFKKLLQRSNVIVDTCDDVDSAKKWITTFKYDAVIADLRLSGSLNMDGLEIVSFTKLLHPETTVALITAYGPTELDPAIKTIGVDFYLEKPVDQKELSRILKCIGVN